MRKFVVKSPRLTRAVKNAVSPVYAKAESPSGRRAGRLDTPMSMGGGGTYKGPFAISYNSRTGKIEISSGYLSRNGEFLTVEEQEISPGTGIICLHTELADGNWTEPEIKFSSPGQTDFPLGECKFSGRGFSVVCYHVAVAVIIVSEECGSENSGDGGGENA